MIKRRSRGTFDASRWFFAYHLQILKLFQLLSPKLLMLKRRVLQNKITPPMTMTLPQRPCQRQILATIKYLTVLQADMRLSSELLSEVENFEKNELKHQEVVEKNVLPNAEGKDLQIIDINISEDVSRENIPSDINNFDKSQLKKMETVEKVVLPKTEGINSINLLFYRLIQKLLARRSRPRLRASRQRRSITSKSWRRKSQQR